MSPAATRQAAARSPRPSLDAGAFGQGEDAIDGDVGPVLLEAIGPPHLDALRLRDGAEAEVHAQVVLRVVAAAAADLLDPQDVAGDEPHAGADGAAVRLRADEADREPVRG